MGEGGKLCKENEAALHAARRARGGTRGKTARASLFRNAAAPYTWNSIGHLSRSPRFFRVEFQRVTSRASRDPRAPRIGRSEAPCCVSASRRPRNSVSPEIRRLRDRDSLNLLFHPRADPTRRNGQAIARMGERKRRKRFQRTDGFAHFRSDCDRCRRCCGEGGRGAPGVNPP